MSTPPDLSIICVFFNMRREAQRSLLSLSRAYQRDVEIDYEVICIDNGSSEPLDEQAVRSFGAEFRHQVFETSSKSPAAAVNFGVRQALAEHVMLIIDGAHILTPRVLAYTDIAMRSFANPLVAVQSMPLGDTAAGTKWDQAAEDRAIATIDWQRNGYELFRLAHSYGDDARGWFGALFESACLTLRKEAFEQLGGLDERFQSPGGGLVLLDFFQRALARPELAYIMLLGESTFHQYHGGAATGASPGDHPWHRFHDEYRSLRGHDFQRIPRLPIYLGQFMPQSLAMAEFSARHGFAFWRSQFGGGQS